MGPCIEPWVDNSDFINAFCSGAALFTKTAGKRQIDKDQTLGVQLFPDGLRKASLSRGMEVLCCTTHDCSSWFWSPWAFFATWLSAVLRLLAAFTFLHVSRNNQQLLAQVRGEETEHLQSLQGRLQKLRDL